jgi:hypothetical protein
LWSYICVYVRLVLTGSNSYDGVPNPRFNPFELKFLGPHEIFGVGS